LTLEQVFAFIFVAILILLTEGILRIWCWGNSLYVLFYTG